MNGQLDKNYHGHWLICTTTQLKGNCHGKKVSLYIAFSGCSRSTSIPKKKLVPQVEIPGSYGQLQNHNLELPVVGGDLSMTNLSEQLLVVGMYIMGVMVANI